MVVKSNTTNATLAATRRLEKVIESHRSYFSDWRNDKFDRSPNKQEDTRHLPSHVNDKTNAK
jgi:hypothetical protein